MHVPGWGEDAVVMFRNVLMMVGADRWMGCSAM